jgi:mono/diheme cytochrome c family protein
MERAVLRKLTSLCIISGLVCLILLGITAIRDGKREWKDYQQEYRRLLLGKISRDINPVLYERVSGMKPEIKQIVVNEFGAVDRCPTCHLGIEDTLFTMAKQPHTTHPNPELLAKHPVEKFGCTICHGGQGAATTYDGASHQTIAHWPDPMVEKRFMQSRCGYCHKDYEAIGADDLALGQKLFEDLYCAGCHKVDAGDGSMAPELSAFADKDTGHFDFTHIDGARSRQNWALEHFLSPSRVTPGSVMRSYAMNDRQVEALTTYVLSLTERVFVRSYYPKEDLVAAKKVIVIQEREKDFSP